MKKPSEITLVKAKKALLLPSSFRAITMFGTVYCNSDDDIKLINSENTVDSTLKCHETIHVRQAENTWNSWIVFYLNYIWQYIRNIPLIFIKVRYAYMFLPYELEAFANETEYDYAYGKADQWRLFNKKLSLKQKKQLAKKYMKSYMPFRNFIQEEILPTINGEE